MMRPSVTATTATAFPSVGSQSGPSTHALLLETLLRHQALELGRPLLGQFVLGDAAGEDHRVHRELLGPEVAVEEVNREDEADRQQPFLAVDQQRDVEPRPGQEPGEELREPQDQPGAADDAHAPEHRPVVELLPVGEVIETGPRPDPQEPAEVRNHLLHVARLRRHRRGPPEDVELLLHEQPVHQPHHVQREGRDHQGREHAVDDARGVRAAEQRGQPSGPRRVAEQQREARERQPQEAEHQHAVQQAVVGVEPLVEDLAGRRSRHRLLPGPPSTTPAAGDRAREPEHGVDAEEEEHADEQRLHESGRVVQQRVARPVVAVGVRVVLREALGRARVALAAGRHQVAARHARPRVALREDVVRAVAVRARRDAHEPQAALPGRGTCRGRCGSTACGRSPHSFSTWTFHEPASTRWISCALWQFTQTGASGLPLPSSWPWMPDR